MSKKVQKRWLVLITLLNNPELIPLRSHHLSNSGRAHKDSAKIVQLFKSGILGIIPANAVNPTMSASGGNYQLRALVANQQNERFQRNNPNDVSDDRRNDIAGDKKKEQSENNHRFSVTMDNELQNYALQDENC